MELTPNTNNSSRENNSSNSNSNQTESSTTQTPTTKQPPHIRIVPHIVDVRRCLYFEVMDRDVPEGEVLRVGRFTEKVSQQKNRIAFKSKVVSRTHAEIWSENGQIYIRDVKSSSGTFLNHMRLSPPNVESDKYPLNDGDILQLGVDYQGGTVDLYKCVKIRLEINRNWQQKNGNPFRQQVLKNIQDNYNKAAGGGSSSLGGGDNDVLSGGGAAAAGGGGGAGSENTECCICLYPMVAFQALFVAPCSHCFHFKCIKPILFTSTGLSCPLCRTYADLEASVTNDENENEAESLSYILPPAVAQNQHQQQQQRQQQQVSNQIASQQQQQQLGDSQNNQSGDNDSNNPQSQNQQQPPNNQQHGVENRSEMSIDQSSNHHHESMSETESAFDSSSARDQNATPGPQINNQLRMREDANATPIYLDQNPNSNGSQSFGSTPVGSVPTNTTDIIDSVLSRNRDGSSSDMPESPTRHISTRQDGSVPCAGSSADAAAHNNSGVNNNNNSNAGSEESTNNIGTLA
ncbi:hypothetical protein H4219_003628 [Mycoemilia scoparia]|uniref:Uncharacterized protein n=1 Tax=Mycoemilia scoparia TaxID=417184 RepID=A0A9W8DMK5_9FUNG|nr:hypothetical protein H4219_003628 [Mycoemilia scoparia]